jgi:hypothetical protein
MATSALVGWQQARRLVPVRGLPEPQRPVVRDGEAVINDVGLAALALLVAASAPKEKDVMIRLVMNMLAGPQP